jgi:D-lactate dehydrogenase
MKILFYSTKVYEQPYLEAAMDARVEAVFTQEPLSLQTVSLAKGFGGISIFTGDDASAAVLEALHQAGIDFIAVRAAGHDNVDLPKAAELGIAVANVPAYSPYAVAEHAVALLLCLNRKLIKANQQVQQHDFTTGNLIGFDLNGKTAGIIGVGRTGSVFAKIMHGFGCRLLGYDIAPNKNLEKLYGLEYVDLPALCRQADIISIHTALTPGTKHLIQKTLIRQMLPGVTIINTSRGGCVDTQDIIDGLESGHIGYYGADVYENERGVFFYDYSQKELKDPLLKELLAMPNVLITPHQAFATTEALTNIAAVTYYNIDCRRKRQPSENELTAVVPVAVYEDGEES